MKLIKRLSNAKERKKVSAKKRAKFKPCGDLVSATLSAHDRRGDKARIGGKLIHVSSLVNGDCLRMLQLAYMHNVVSFQRPRHSDRLLWAIGKAVEAHIRESLIDLYGRENALGKWECSCKAFSYSGFGNDERCATCNELPRYSEYHTVNKKSCLSGSPDLILKDDSEDLTVLEIKSIKVVPKNGVRTSAPDFHNLACPSRNHELQGLTYRRLLQLEGHRVSPYVIVAYAAKDYVMEQPYKFFSIAAKDESNTLPVRALFKEGRAFRSSLESGELLPRCSKCPNKNSTTAKGCPVVNHCFPD